MSLEAVLTELNTNVLALIGALQHLGAPAEAEAAPPPPKASRKPLKPAVPADEKLEQPTFDDVKSAVLAIAAKSRDAAVDLLARHGVKKVTELKPDQYLAVIKDVIGE